MQSATDYAIVTLDPEGRVRTWSNGAQQILGWSEREMVGQTVDRLFTAEDIAANAPAADRERAAGSGGSRAERWQVCKDGRRLWASTSVVPLRADMNGVTGFILVMRDRTLEKSEQDAMQRANAWLEDEVTARTAALMEANTQLRREIEERERAEQALRQAQKMEAIDRQGRAYPGRPGRSDAARQLQGGQRHRRERLGGGVPGDRAGL